MKASRFKIAMTLLLLSIYLLMLMFDGITISTNSCIISSFLNNKIFTKTTGTVQSGQHQQRRRQRQGFLYFFLLYHYNFNYYQRQLGTGFPNFTPKRLSFVRRLSLTWSAEMFT
jgi:hypothetical protein